MNAYTVSHVTRSIILTRDFAKKASILGTEEYKIFLNLRRDNPEYEVIQRTIAKKEGKYRCWIGDTGRKTRSKEHPPVHRM